MTGFQQLSLGKVISEFVAFLVGCGVRFIKVYRWANGMVPCMRVGLGRFIPVYIDLAGGGAVSISGTDRLLALPFWAATSTFGLLSGNIYV